VALDIFLVVNQSRQADKSIKAVHWRQTRIDRFIVRDLLVETMLDVCEKRHASAGAKLPNGTGR
jgi:hypothetical protein